VHRTTIRLLAVLAGGLCLAAAGGAAARAPDDPATHTVTIEGMTFVPETLTVTRGDTVVWINKDLVPHTATSKKGGFDSQAIAAGESWKLVVSKRGELPYVCAFHPTMKGTLRVR
jgi:plastocyanin